MNWKIKTLEYTNDDDKGVVTAHYCVSLTDEEHYVRRYGMVSFQPDPSSEDYIHFDDLTEEIVVSWIQSAINIQEIEANLLSQIEKKKKFLRGIPW